MDFGLAKMSNLLFFSATELVDFSLPAASGTPEYISPEQIQNVDMEPRSDIYSTGVILYELLTGRRPFERSNVDGLLQAHLSDSPPPFSALGVAALISPSIEAVVRSCLEKYPENRPPCASELAQRFDRALGRKPLPNRPSGVRALVGTPPVNVPTPIPGRMSGVRPAVNVAAGSPSRVPPVKVFDSPTSNSSVSTKALDPAFFRHGFESVMPDAMALIKLKGFIHDLGGDVVESLPGVVRVRIPWLHSDGGSSSTAKSGLFAWARRAPKVAPSAMEMEVHMERLHPDQPTLMTVTMVMRSPRGIMTADSRNQCQKLGLDLQAYLMGR